MNKRILSLLLLFVLSFSAIAMFLPKGQATVVTSTVVITSDLASGRIYNYTAPYDTAHNTTIGGIYTGYNYLRVGQRNNGVDRAFLFFDTSTLPSGVTITAATLSIKIASISRDSTYNITIQNGSATVPHNPLISTDFDQTSFSGNFGSSNATLMTLDYNNITLSAAGLGLVNVGGWTNLVLRSSEDIAYTYTGFNTITFEGGTSKLYVTYTTNNNYVFEGPYYNSGAVATNTTLKVNYNAINGTTSQAYWNSTASPFNQTLGGNLLSLTWNVSSSLNYTGLIDFFPTENASRYYLYTINGSNPSTYYTINLIDFYGMTNPYLQISNTQTPITTDTGVASYTNVLYRHYLNSSSTVPFALEQFTKYQLSVICDQGTYTQDLTTGTDLTINIPIMVGAFPLVNNTEPTFITTRTNATQIQSTYTDSSSLTNWLAITITHRSGSTTITDYTSNTTGSIQTIYWNSAVSDVGYQVSAIANVNGTTKTWTLQAPQPAATNPFDGAFDFLGVNTATVPFYYTGWPAGISSSQIAQLVAAFVIACFIGVGSFRNAGASMIAACIVGGIMFAMGWWNGGLTISTTSAIPLWGLAFFIAVITHFNEKKSEGQGLN